MKYVLLWSTVREGVQWAPYGDDAKDRLRLVADLQKLGNNYGVYLLWWRLFEEGTGRIVEELTGAKAGDIGKLEC